jgi:hypothetical protein
MGFPEQTQKKAVEQLVNLYLPAGCTESIPVARRATMLVAILFSAGIWFLVSGCLSPAQESDWQWKQYSPEYRPPYPVDPGHF